MDFSTPHSEQAMVSSVLKAQRTGLEACILLAPLSISLFVLTWPANLREPIAASAMAGSFGNTLHFIGGIAASFFLPLGYL